MVVNRPGNTLPWNFSGSRIEPLLNYISTVTESLLHVQKRAWVICDEFSDKLFTTVGFYSYVHI